jgi:methylmalonyl-CoA mutase N-terminal domain/subunit
VGWIQRELSGEGDPARSNEQLKYLIANGQTGIDVIADSPSNALLDPDHPMAVNSVGTQGVSICSLQDFRELWKDLPLESITISNSIPAMFTVAALYLVAKENNIPPENLRGSIQTLALVLAGVQAIEISAFERDLHGPVLNESQNVMICPEGGCRHDG